MFSITQNPLFHILQNAQNILIAGAGGGFDIYSGVPLFVALKAQGKNVHLANLSFSFLHKIIAEEVFSNCFEVTSFDVKKNVNFDYFPEKYLAEWLFNKYQTNIPVYAFPKVGVVQLKNAYKYLLKRYNIDAVILIDGGTDSLMFGQESGLGSPSEDYASMSAVCDLGLTETYLVCLGFGIDHFHGVSHYDVLQNIAKLSETKDYLGCFSITNNNDEHLDFLNLVKYANNYAIHTPSIVCNSVKNAIEGYFGDYHATTRTTFSKLFINPLMNIYWAFRLEGIEKNNPLLKMLQETRSFNEIQLIIEKYRDNILISKKQNIPL